MPTGTADLTRVLAAASVPYKQRSTSMVDCLVWYVERQTPPGGVCSVGQLTLDMSGRQQHGCTVKVFVRRPGVVMCAWLACRVSRRHQAQLT
jgi:hypothetical protein